MTSVELVVPDGVGAGELMLVEFGGTSYEVGVPEGSASGDAITVELPAAAAEPGQVELVVPDGVGAGDLVLVDAPGGASFEVAVPSGCGPGDRITVSLPAEQPAAEPKAPADAAAAPELPATRTPEVPATHAGAFRIGQRVQVLRSNGEFSAAFVADYHAPSELYKVELYSAGSNIFKEGLREEDLSSSWEQLYVPSAGRRQYGSDSDTSSDASGDSDACSSSWSSDEGAGTAVGVAPAPRKPAAAPAPGGARSRVGPGCAVAPRSAPRVDPRAP